MFNDNSSCSEEKNCGDSLTCKFCFELFQRPVMLSCGHSVCSACATTLASFQPVSFSTTVNNNNKKQGAAFTLDSPKNKQNTEGRRRRRSAEVVSSLPASDTPSLSLSSSATTTAKVICPTCSTTTEVPNTDNNKNGLVSTLRVNHDLKSAVEAFQAARATCCECESQPAVVECPKCESSFCQQCYAEVHTHKALRSHQSVPISGANKKASIVRCSQHHGEVIKMFCRQCNQSVCTMCALGSHKPHDCVPIVDMVDEQCKELRKSMGEGGEMQCAAARVEESLSLVVTRIRRVHERHDRIDESINGHFDQLLITLNERRQELLGISAGIRQQQVGILQEQEAFLSEAKGEVTKLIRQTHSLISSLSSSSSTTAGPAKMNALAINRTKCERMSTHLRNINLGVGVEDHVHWQINPAIAKEAIESLGTLRVHEATQHLFKVNAIASIDSQQQPPPQIKGPYSDAVLLRTSTEPLKEFTFSKIWDTNGLLWWLGTEQGTRTEWTNPATSGIIHVTVSSMSQCINQGRITSASAFVDRNHLNMCFTNDERGSWVEVDLVHFRIRPSHYTLRSDKHLRHKLRNWVLQGRNDLTSSSSESEWVTLSTHIKDRTISDYFPFSAGSWPITSATTYDASPSSSSLSSLSSSSYRYLRILQTGENSYNYHCLMMAGFEVYGQLFPSHHQA